MTPDLHKTGVSPVCAGTARLLRRGLLLEYATLAWNVVGCVVALASAWMASSVALAGFGLDSVIEIFASVVVVWQLTGVDKARERTALRLIGTAFLALAVYVLVQSAYTIITGIRPNPSPGGMVWLALTFAAMLALAYGKNHRARHWAIRSCKASHA